MAKLLEETVTIRMSKLVGKNDDESGFVDDNVVQTLEEAAKELIQDPKIVVEAEKDEEGE